MENYHHRAELIIDLQDRGYDQDFVIDNHGILNIQQSELLAPEEFEVTETHLVSERPSEGGCFMVCGIKSIHSDIKGILVTPYGRLFQGLSSHLWAKFSSSITIDAL